MASTVSVLYMRAETSIPTRKNAWTAESRRLPGLAHGGVVARFNFRERQAQLGEHVLPLLLAGFVLWLMAAMAVRIFPAPFQGGWMTVAAYAAGLPVAELLMLLLGVLLGLKRAQRLSAAVVLSAVVLLLVGLSLAAFPAIYGADPVAMRTGAGWLVWSSALLLLSAWYASTG